MAKYKYKVKAQDNWASLGNPRQLMELNPGVPHLSKGQTIFLPQPPHLPKRPAGTVPLGANAQVQAVDPGNLAFNTGYAPYNNALGNIPQPASNVFTPNIAPAPGMFPQNPATANFGLYGAGNNQHRPVAPTVGGSFVSGNGQVNTQDNLQGLLGTNYSANGQQTSGTVRPAGTYTGGNDANSQAWRQYWNDQARAGNQHHQNNPIRTKQDVWDLKAAQRRKMGGRGSAPVVTPTPKGNAVNTSLSWRVG